MIITNKERYRYYTYMIKGIGIDIVEIDRLNQSIKKQARLPERILTKNELERYTSFTKEQRKVEFLAGRFAAKEAAAKATGRGIGALSFQHIEVTSNEWGAPQLLIEGYEKEFIHVTISHSKHYAVAQVIIEES